MSTLGKYDPFRLGRLLVSSLVPVPVKTQIVKELEKRKQPVLLATALGLRCKLNIQEEVVLALERLGASDVLKDTLDNLTDKSPQAEILNFISGALLRVKAMNTDAFDKTIAEIYESVVALEKS